MHRPLTWISAAGLAATALPAAAHVVIAQPEAAANSYFVAAFRVGHGCDGAATTALRVSLPPGVASAKPQPKPGWTAEVSNGAATWRGGRLADAEFDEFAILVHLPATPGPLYFPTVQICETGERRWVQIPEPGAAWTSVPSPAPVVTIAGPDAAHQH